MMIYCWEELMFPGEFKIGEHWVNDSTLDDAINDTIIGRIRASLGVRKDHFDRGDRIKVHFVIDASDYALEKNKFHPRSKLDSELHQLLEGRYGLGEVFQCDLDHIYKIIEQEIGSVNTSPIETKIKSKKFKELVKMKDKRECIFTQGDPVELWQDIIDQIPTDKYYNKRSKFLVVACGYGTEVIVLIEKLKSFGWVDSDIRKAIYINDKSDQFTKPWEALGFKVIVGDFLYLDFDMKFDVLVGNPPYQSPKAGDGSLWPRFIQKGFNALKNDGYIGWVVPSRFALPGPNIREGRINCWDSYIRPYTLLYLNLGECSRHFTNVGFTSDYFGAFVMKKSKELHSAKIVTNEGTFSKTLSNMTYLPLRGNLTTFQIFEKVQNWYKVHGGYYFQRGERDIARKSRKVGFKKVRFYDYEKVFITDFIGDVDWTTVHKEWGWCPIPEDATEKTVNSVFYSKLFRFLAKHMKDDTFNQGFQRNLPGLDLTRVWTDADIYNEIGLELAEIELIESTIL
jgi:SAM-dependent methyltransferase